VSPKVVYPVDRKWGAGIWTEAELLTTMPCRSVDLVIAVTLFEGSATLIFWKQKQSVPGLWKADGLDAVRLWWLGLRPQPVV